MLSALASYPAIFSPLGHTTMAAEAPDPHSGDLGSLEEARNGQNSVHAVGHSERF